MHHVVNSIVAPFGAPIEDRPAVPTLQERIESREAKRARKEAKRWREGGVVEGEGVEGVVLEVNGEGTEGQQEKKLV